MNLSEALVEETIREASKNMLEKDFSVEEIVDILKYPLDLVKEVAEEINIEKK